MIKQVCLLTTMNVPEEHFLHANVFVTTENSWLDKTVGLRCV